MDGMGEVGLQVLSVVPHQRGDALVIVDAQAAQRARELGGAGADLAVGAAPPRRRPWPR